jgi:dTDP-4-amino-4,6-dideoxygalactose transaminase
MTSERYIYDVLGYNYRMTNLQAALLTDQLRDIDAILARKRTVRNRYATLLSEWLVSDGLWMNVLRIPGGISTERLHAVGIDTRPMFYPIYRHAHLRCIETVWRSIKHQELVMIPSSPNPDSLRSSLYRNSDSNHHNRSKSSRRSSDYSREAESIRLVYYP